MYIFHEEEIVSMLKMYLVRREHFAGMLSRGYLVSSAAK